MTARFLRLVGRKFGLEKFSKKLQAWPELDFGGFVGELKKAKVKLGLTEELEWEELFTRERAAAADLTAAIARRDRAIDGLVFDLYGLGAGERGLVLAAGVNN